MRFPKTLFFLIPLFLMPMPAPPGIGPLPHGVAWAEEVGAITGSVRASWWSEAKNPDAGPGALSASLWAKGGASAFDGKTAFHGEGWLRGDSLINHMPAKGELREGYFDFSTENFDIRAGRQIIAWGRTDAVNPTDNLVMRDYTLHAPDDADQKSGVGALKGAYSAGDFRVIAVWLPEFRANRLPFPKGMPSVSEVMPDNALSQWAAKVEYATGAYDCSVSYFDGFDRNPDFALGGSGVTMRYSRLKVYGADGAFTSGRYGFRAEAAYLASEDADGQDLFTKNPAFFAVAGGDRTFGDNFNINLQYLFRQVVNYRAPGSITPAAAIPLAEAAAFAANQYDETQHGVTFRISDKWLNDTLEAELAGLIWLQHGDSLIRPKISYALNDAVSLSAGVESYQGPRNSFFGRLTEFTAFFAESRWHF